MTYEKYNLKINPFTDHSLAYRMIDRVATENTVKKCLAGCVDSKNPAIVPLIGQYGVGKTFLLRHIEDKILAGLFLEDDRHKLLAAYLTATLPRLSSEYIHYLYSESVKRIGHQRFTSLVTELHRKKRGKDSLKNFDPDFLSALMNYEKNEDVAWEYFKGSTIGRHDAESIGVKRSIRDDEQSLIALANLLRLLFVLGYDCMVFLVDEFEYLFARGSNRGAQFLNTFRFLYDRALDQISKEGDIANPIFLFACSIITWNDIVKDAEKQTLGTKPFIDRSMEDITIPPFTAKETREFMLTRLEKWRISDKNKNQIGLFPFSDDKNDNPFELITKISDGLPRRILKNSALILDDALNSSYEVIGAKEVQTIVQSQGLERKEEQVERPPV